MPNTLLFYAFGCIIWDRVQEGLKTQIKTCTFVEREIQTMSQDMLVSVFQAVEAVPTDHLGLIKDFAHKLSGNRNTKWAQQGALFLRQEACWKEPFAELGDIVILEVNYDLSLEEMVAAGHYDWKNGDINAKRFPLAGKGVLWYEARYFHFDRNISSEAANKAIMEEDVANPWMSAPIEHLLTFGARFPEEQRKHPIVGLGSSARVRGYRDVPCLCEYDSRHELNLGWWDGGWAPDCRFLAVRKVSVPQV